MADDKLYVEVIRVAPKEEDKARLLEMRDELVALYSDKPSFVAARLLQPYEGDTWVDLWIWKNKTEGKQVVAENADHPLSVEWRDRATLDTYEGTEVLTDH